MSDRDEKARKGPLEVDPLRQTMTKLDHCEADRKRTEKELQKSRGESLDLFNALEEVAFLMDRGGEILVANRNAALLYGVPQEALPGRSLYDLIPRDRVESSKRKVTTVVETRRPVRFEGKLGEKIFENSLYPVLVDGPEVERIAVYVRDITEKKRLETSLHQAEEKYRNIYENAIEGIFQIDPEGLSDLHPKARLAGAFEPGRFDARLIVADRKSRHGVVARVCGDGLVGRPRVHIPDRHLRGRDHGVCRVRDCPRDRPAVALGERRESQQNQTHTKRKPPHTPPPM